MAALLSQRQIYEGNIPGSRSSPGLCEILKAHADSWNKVRTDEQGRILVKVKDWMSPNNVVGDNTQHVIVDRGTSSWICQQYPQRRREVFDKMLDALVPGGTTIILLGRHPHGNEHARQLEAIERATEGRATIQTYNVTESLEAQKIGSYHPSNGGGFDEKLIIFPRHTIPVIPQMTQFPSNSASP